jgi:hypothetical protein
MIADAVSAMHFSPYEWPRPGKYTVKEQGRGNPAARAARLRHCL